jgi:hypothetical protein
VRFHAEIPLISLLRLAHLRVALVLFVLRRGRRRDQRRIHDRAAAQQRATRFQMLFHGREDRFRQIVAFEQMAEVEDRRLVGNGIAPEVEPRERAHRLNIVKRFLGAGIGELIPLLQAINTQHCRQRKCPPPALRTHLRIERIDHRFERRPRHHSRHIREEHLALRALLLCSIVER